MKRALHFCLGLAFGLAALLCVPAQAQQHRATRLGHPATRFAPTIHTVDDLRSQFRDEKLRPDMASILSQWGWTGKLADLDLAALTQEIIDWKIPIGSRVPFMSSRKDDVPISLRDVLWAGDAPARAYAFTFSSRGQRYRCITPEACSNFFLEELRPEPTPVPTLALQCNSPERQFTGRLVKLVFTIRNSGDGTGPKATISVPIPAGATATGATDGGVIGTDRITWEISNLAPNAPREVSATFTTERAGRMDFALTASGAAANPAHCECHTQILGVYAVLVEVVDLEDPVEVVTYVITVTNQGNQTGTGIRVVCRVPDSQESVYGNGTTAVRAQGRTVPMQALPTLDGKAVATWRVLTKALRSDDSRFKVEFTTDSSRNPFGVKNPCVYFEHSKLRLVSGLITLHPLTKTA